jgi:prepilin-type N-terminal cleavage/methylation domain-containing protein
MQRRHSIAGWTLVEVMLVVAIIGIFAGGFVVLFTRNVTFFKRMQARQQVIVQSRSGIERIEQMLHNGKANSLVISTPASAIVKPNSKIEFTLRTPLPDGAVAYSIYLNGDTVYGQESGPGISRAPTVLAKSVTGLMFTGDALDAANVGVSLQIDVPYDASRTPPIVVSMLIPNRIIHMAEAP